MTWDGKTGLGVRQWTEREEPVPLWELEHEAIFGMLQEAFGRVYGGFLLVELPLEYFPPGSTMRCPLSSKVILVVNGVSAGSRARLATFATLLLVHVLRVCTLAPSRTAEAMDDEREPPVRGDHTTLVGFHHEYDSQCPLRDMEEQLGPGLRTMSGEERY